MEKLEIEMPEITQEDIEQAQIISYPLYEISEVKKDKADLNVSLFDLQVVDLVYEKMYLLFEKLQVAQVNKNKADLTLKVHRDKLVLETDFSEVLGKARTNKEEREAWIKPQLEQFENRVQECEEWVQFYTDKIKIVNDLINAKMLLLKIEANL